MLGSEPLPVTTPHQAEPDAQQIDNSAQIPWQTLHARFKNAALARVAIDVAPFDTFSAGSGFYRYMLDLLSGLSEISAPVEFVILGSKPAPIPELAAVFARAPARFSYVAAPLSSGRLAYFMRQFQYAQLLRQLRVDVWHALHSFVPVFARCPVAVTVYDLMIDIFPEYAAIKRSRAHRLYFWSLRYKARRLLCISESTAKDLSRLWPIERERIRVVHLGVAAHAPPSTTAPTLFEKLAGQLVISSPYNLEPRKNLSKLLDATARVVKEHPQTQLVLFGRAALSPARERAFSEQISALGLQHNLILPGILSDADLNWLYRRSDLFVFPTLYEGFGLPALEAMNQGACVVVRGDSAMAEVVGDAGVWVDVENADILAQALLELAADPARRRTLGERARLRAQTFSVAKMAQQTLACYAELLAEK